MKIPFRVSVKSLVLAPLLLWGCNHETVTGYYYSCEIPEGHYYKVEYAAFPQTQTVVQKSAGFVFAPIPNCNVFDSKNWTCYRNPHPIRSESGHVYDLEPGKLSLRWWEWYLLYSEDQRKKLHQNCLIVRKAQIGK
jgi:hypothetical protein